MNVNRKDPFVGGDRRSVASASRVRNSTSADGPCVQGIGSDRRVVVASPVTLCGPCHVRLAPPFSLGVTDMVFVKPAELGLDRSRLVTLHWPVHIR